MTLILSEFRTGFMILVMAKAKGVQMIRVQSTQK